MRKLTIVLVVLISVCTITWGDVMISPDGSTHAALDYHPPTGNLFAVIEENSDWSLFISIDDGANWIECYRHEGIFQSGRDVDMQVQGDHVYVATSVRNTLVDASNATIRRFSATTGAHDDAWGPNTVISYDDRRIEEISLVVADGGTILVGLLDNLDRINVRVSSISHPAGWAYHSPNITDAERGLDMAYPGSSHGELLSMSYVATDGGLYFIRLNEVWIWSDLELIAVDDTIDKSSVAAVGNDVIIAWAFKDPSSPYQGVRSIHGYNVSHYSLDWDVWPAWESNTTAFHDPIVAVGDDGSNAMIYEKEGSIIFRLHSGFDVPWSPEITVVNEHDFVLGDGDTFAFEWIGDGYGIVYPAASGGVYFIRSQIFADSFESGDLSRWSESTM